MASNSIYRSFFLVVVCVAGGLLAAPSTLLASNSIPSTVLSAAEQRAIAGAFAPVLVFHPDEEYYPLDSRFAMRTGSVTAANPTADGGASSVAAELGSIGDRVTEYRSLSRDSKLALAAVGYRAFSRFNRGEREIVVEYWCHYVYNAYTIRLGWLRYHVSDNHPEDLERLYLVLTEMPGAEDAPVGETDEAWALRSFRVKRVVANAHDGSVPPNEYDVDARHAIGPPLTILVERGSHAMAPDINHDGRFTPSIDSTSTGKQLWGIRDAGNTWGWYRPSFMDIRDPATAVRLCPSSHMDSDGYACRPYSLYGVDDLQRWFDTLQLSAQERLDVVGHTAWFERVFGDVRIENLTVPSDAADGRNLDHMLNRREKTQSGMEAGFTWMNHTPAPMIGRQFYWNVPSRRMPDVMADARMVFPAGQRTAIEATLAASYALDATTNVIAGESWFSDNTPPAEPIAGVDIRAGRFHVRVIHWLLQNDIHASLVALF